MRIFLTDNQFEKLAELITTDVDFHAYVDTNYVMDNHFYDGIDDFYTIVPAEWWSGFIKQKYKIIYRTSHDESSPIYYGSLYGTKSRINMFLLRL